MPVPWPSPIAIAQPYVAGRLEHAERHRVDVRDRERAGVVRGRREVGRRLEHAEEVRLLEDHRRGVLRRRRELVGVGRAAAVRNLDDVEAEARARTS